MARVLKTTGSRCTASGSKLVPQAAANTQTVWHACRDTADRRSCICTQARMRVGPSCQRSTNHVEAPGKLDRPVACLSNCPNHASMKERCCSIQVGTGASNMPSAYAPAPPTSPGHQAAAPERWRSLRRRSAPDPPASTAHPHAVSSPPRTPAGPAGVPSRPAAQHCIPPPPAPPLAGRRMHSQTRSLHVVDVHGGAWMSRMPCMAPRSRPTARLRSVLLTVVVAAPSLPGLAAQLLGLHTE